MISVWEGSRRGKVTLRYSLSGENMAVLLEENQKKTRSNKIYIYFFNSKKRKKPHWDIPVLETRQTEPWRAEVEIAAFLHCSHTDQQSCRCWPHLSFPRDVGLVRHRFCLAGRVDWEKELIHQLNPAAGASRSALTDSSNKAVFLWSSFNGFTGKAASVKSHSFLPFWTQVLFGSEILHEHPRHPAAGIDLGLRSLFYFIALCSFCGQ